MVAVCEMHTTVLTKPLHLFPTPFFHGGSMSGDSFRFSPTSTSLKVWCLCLCLVQWQLQDSFYGGSIVSELKICLGGVKNKMIIFFSIYTTFILSIVI